MRAAHQKDLLAPEGSAGTVHERAHGVAQPAALQRAVRLLAQQHVQHLPRAAAPASARRQELTACALASCNTS